MPPWALTYATQSWYPRMTALPGSEKSPLSESEAPIVIGGCACGAAVEPAASHAAGTRPRMSAAASVLPPILRLTIDPPLSDNPTDEADLCTRDREMQG